MERRIKNISRRINRRVPGKLMAFLFSEVERRKKRNPSPGSQQKKKKKHQQQADSSTALQTNYRALAYLALIPALFQVPRAVVVGTSIYSHISLRNK
jgi:hypothetical protein